MNGPDVLGTPSRSRTSAFCRLAAVHTPMTELELVASVPAAPFASSFAFGTWITIVCTFTAFVAFTPGAGPRELGDVEAELRVELLERSQVAEIEHRAEVDVETLAPLTGEDAAAARQADGSRRWRAPCSSASTAARCCTAGTAHRSAASVLLPLPFQSMRVTEYVCRRFHVLASSDVIGPTL